MRPFSTWAPPTSSPAESADRRQPTADPAEPVPSAIVTTAAVPLLPRHSLFGNPERISPRVSPDGTRLGWIAPDRGVLNVWVAPVGRMEDGVVVTDDRERGIRTFAWAHDQRHLLYIQDRGGDENWRLYAVDLVDGGNTDLTPFQGV